MNPSGPLRVLFLTTYFPPTGGSSVQRPAKYVKYLEQFNCRVHVLTEQDFRKVRDESILRDIPASASIHRVFSLEPECLQNKIEQHFANAALMRLFLKGMLKIYSVLYYRMALVDWSMGWVPFAVRKGAEIVRTEGIDVIYALSPPPTPFLVGYLLKRKFGLPLVIDYSDPWTTDPFYPKGKGFQRLNRPLCRFLESRCLRAADRIAHCKKKTNTTIFKQFEGLDQTKFVFIPNGYDPADFPKPDPDRAPRPYRIVYTGKLTNRYCYSPRSFFWALRALLEEKEISKDEVEVLMAGIVSRENLELIEENGLQNIVRHLGYLDHDRCTELVQSADVLLLLVESPLGQKASQAYAGSMPAKIFEYLFMGKPILGIVPEGAEADVLRQSRLGWIAQPNNVESVKQALAELLKARKGVRRLDPDWGFIGTFDRRELTGRLASVFHGLDRSTEQVVEGRSA
ncbi:MAG TPA: glycosyltransferase family 4 protein [Syntrophales bacterium]|nr:glycosyltransferase family 4 protein [Syntrophales bacterium]